MAGYFSFITQVNFSKHIGEHYDGQNSVRTTRLYNIEINAKVRKITTI